MDDLTQQQKQRAVVVAILVVIIIAACAWKFGRSGAEGSGSMFSFRSEVISPEEAIAATPVAPAAAAQAKTPAVDVPLNYGDAINAYGDVRFQFVSCNGSPGSMVTKKGSVIMLDNRDNKAHVIAMGKATYNVKALDYALAIANETGDLQVTCDGGGAATISVQP